MRHERLNLKPAYLTPQRRSYMLALVEQDTRERLRRRRSVVIRWCQRGALLCLWIAVSLAVMLATLGGIIP